MSDPELGVNDQFDDPADKVVARYLDPSSPGSFFLFSGAGSGKTRSLVHALNYIRDNYTRRLALRGACVGVITYTNAARDEISRRVEFNPLFHVSTIHSFAWDLIRGFDQDIREWLRENLISEITTIEEEERRGRQGTKASVTRQSKIASKTRRLERLDQINAFVYSPNGENREANALNHSEVLSICASFVSNKPLMGSILVGRFPFLLIDESQDTNRHIVDALFRVEKEHMGRFCLGLIGDVMQRIYPDGKHCIEDDIPETWGRPNKAVNYRCPTRVVELINKVREPVDGHVQVPKEGAIQGFIRLFIRHSGAAGRADVELEARRRMAVLSGDKAWETQEACKILTLEHHMAAKRLGFEGIWEPLYGIDSWRTGLLDGTLPAVRWFAEWALPLVEALRKGDEFAVARILRSGSPLIAEDAMKGVEDSSVLLRRARCSVDSFWDLWLEEEPTCGEVLSRAAEVELFEIPEVLKPVVAVLHSGEGSADDENADPIAPETQALLQMANASFSQVALYWKYVKGEASFDTHQGVKGLEFSRVMVIMDDAEARGFMFGYGKLLGEKEPTKRDMDGAKEGRDTSIERTRRLFYVTCSRAIHSLCLMVYADDPEAVKSYVTASGWFAESEISVH